ncbi:hypothetical protein QIG62_27450, partial [Klebsiella pneumoniae]|nr:hypothetical protein [Klebsiella pneumoniae]
MGEMSDADMSHMKGHDDHPQKQTAANGHKSHGTHQMTSEATTPQLAALAGVTTFLLISGMVLPGFKVNLGL